MSKEEPKKRKTILEQASEARVRDPAGHARHSVSELDKTAKRSAAQRKKCNDQIEADLKEIHNIDEQIARINERYLPLCDHLKESIDRKKHLISMLDHCVADEKKMMGDMKGTVQVRMIDDAKLHRHMATMELQTIRGFSMQPESTFHQSRTLVQSGSHSMKSSK